MYLSEQAICRLLKLSGNSITIEKLRGMWAAARAMHPAPKPPVKLKVNYVAGSLVAYEDVDGIESRISLYEFPDTEQFNALVDFWRSE